MTRTIPTGWAVPGMGEIAHPRAIEGEEWETMIRAGHWLYARTGLSVPSLVPTTGRGLAAPDWAETTNSAYNQINESAGAELSQREGQWRLTRLLAGFTAHRIRVRAYGIGSRLRLAWWAIDQPGLWSGAVTLTFGASASWQEATFYIVPPGELYGGTGPKLRLIRGYPQHRVVSGVGKVYQVEIEEDQVLVEADLASE